MVRAVEVASVFILALFVWLQPAGTRRQLAWDAFLMGAGAVLGEETCIWWYRFYSYSPEWSLKVVNVPVMVGCIWPAVILSARQVVQGLSGRTGAWPVAALVLFDASLVEAVSVRSGLWGWVEGAVLGVPLSGLLGWAAYSGLASLALDRRWHPVARLVVPGLLTHAILVTSWWGLFKWVGREPWPVAWLAGGSCVVAVVLAAWWWPRRWSVPMQVMGPRVVAALLFFGLVALAGGDVVPLALFAGPFALPYVLVTRWPGMRPVAASHAG